MAHLRGTRLVACAAVVLPAALGTALPEAGRPAGSAARQAAPSPPVVPASVELVELEVLVRDRDGSPVSDLRIEDFEVRDNGRRRAISHLALRQIRREPAPGDAPTPKRPWQPALSAQETRRVVAFVVDTLRSSVESFILTRRMLEDFVAQEMAPTDLTLIMSTTGGSGLLQQFTADRRVLRRAAARLLPFIEPVDVYDKATFETLDTVVEAMARLPGRRLLIFVGEGWADLIPRSRLRETARRAAEANVVLYAINPLGLEGPMESAADSVVFEPRGERPTGGTRGKDRFWTDASLMALAEPSGGRAFVDWNDISAAVSHALRENDRYYVLGFQPEDREWDGRYHRVRVSVPGRSDLVVSTRQGYVARREVSPAAGDTASGETAEAIASPLIRREIDVVMTPLYDDDGDGQPRLTTLLHIDPDALVFEEVGGRRRVHLERIAYLLNESGKVVDSFRSTTTLELGEDAYRETLRRGLLSTRETRVKPGLYQARALVRDLRSGRIGTTSGFVEIPKMRSGRLALSSIFTDVRYLQTPGSAAAGAGATLSQRRFPRGSAFGFRLLIYGATDGRANTSLNIRTRILRRGEAVRETAEVPVEALQGSTPHRIVTGGTVRLDGLEPDEYLLEVLVGDPRRAARQQIDFVVD